MNLMEIADALEGGPRQGAAEDRPEGVRYVVLSDTLINQITRELRLAAAERPDAEALDSPK